MRLCGNTILVKLDPESDRTQSGILFKPGDAMEHTLRTGEVVDTGPGKYLSDSPTSARQPLDVVPGDGIVFVKFLATHTETAKGLQKLLPKDHVLLQLSDIMLVYDRKDPPVFSQ